MSERLAGGNLWTELQTLIKLECYLQVEGSIVINCDYWQLWCLRRVITEFLDTKADGWRPEQTFTLSTVDNSRNPSAVYRADITIAGSTPSIAPRIPYPPVSKDGTNQYDYKPPLQKPIPDAAAGDRASFKGGELSDGSTAVGSTFSSTRSRKFEDHGVGHQRFITTEWHYRVLEKSIVVEQEMIVFLSARGGSAFRDLLVKVENKPYNKLKNETSIKLQKLKFNDKEKSSFEVILKMIEATSKVTVKLHVPLLGGLINNQSGKCISSLNDALRKVLIGEREGDFALLTQANKTKFLKEDGIAFEYEIRCATLRTESERIAQVIQFEMRNLVLQFCPNILMPIQNVSVFNLSFFTANPPKFLTKILVYKADIVKLPVDAIVNAANENLINGAGVAGIINLKLPSTY